MALPEQRDIDGAAIAWYKSTNPLRVDLVGDLAGKELFVIHGDALMLYCITKAKVDLQGMSYAICLRGLVTDHDVFTEGFQLLHAVHAIESFLCKLKDRGCSFHIIWIQDHENLCLPGGVPEELHSHYLLMRAVLTRHLQRQQCDVVCKGSTVSQMISFEFQSLEDLEFEQYLTLNVIRFFLCLDGPTFDACANVTALSFLSIAHHLAARGYSLAFINDIEFASSGVGDHLTAPSINLGTFTDLWFPSGSILCNLSHVDKKADGYSSSGAIHEKT